MHPKTFLLQKGEKMIWMEKFVGMNLSTWMDGHHVDTDPKVVWGVKMFDGRQVILTENMRLFICTNALDLSVFEGEDQTTDELWKIGICDYSLAMNRLPENLLEIIKQRVSRGKNAWKKQIPLFG